MKIIHISNNKTNDITELITKVKWSGDSKQVARKIDFGIVSSSTDKSVPVINIKMGDLVKLLDDNGKEKFQGYVFSKGKSVNSSEIEITCYDGLIYFIKSKGTYNFKNQTPGAITRRMCKDFGVAAAPMHNGTPISRIFDAENIYNIIMTAYTLESNKTKKQYIPLMDKGRLTIAEKGKKISTYVLDPSTSIMDANYTESIENSINRVKIYNEEGKYIGQVSLSGIPGILQDIYKGKEGNVGGRSLLKGIEKTAEIESLGDFECTTGNAVIVKEKHTGLNGLFFIESDEHTFENGMHKMNLGLEFKNMMDRQTSGDDPAEIAKREAEQKSNSSSSSSNSKPNSKAVKSTSSVSTSKRSKFISAAQKMIGYNYSQANRMGSRSADCSSLVGRAMKSAGITNNAQLTTRSIHSDGRFQRINKSQMVKGDILWEKGHMGIYMGGNKTLEARWSTKKVGYSTLGKRFSYAFRIKGI